jgi:hypothetical protein
MQALSLAIGPAGITYFAQQLVASQITKALAGLTPPSRVIPIPDFAPIVGGGVSDSYSNISITLSNGSLSGFNPGYQGITQNPQNQNPGNFQLTLVANAFGVNYAWHEVYDDYHCDPSANPPYKVCHQNDNQTGDFAYGPAFGSLTTVITLGFQYNQQANSYDIVVVGTPDATPAGAQANIPGGSIIQNEDSGCFSSHVSDATANAVSSIDFSTPISRLFSGVLASIAASGNLTPDITYNFAVGDSGLTFPGGSGLAIGVTGNVTYKGTAYSGTPPTGLPVPPPPTDAHHLQLYVSNYEMDALYWAFYQAGELAVTVHASDLPDPDVLKCKTYSPAIKAFQPYAAFAMQADVVPQQAPTIAFQQVWVLTSAVMTTLGGQLPSNVYPLLEGLAGNAYAAQTALETDLSNATIDQEYWSTIEQAAAGSGMVLTQDLEFTLTILNGATTEPNIVFKLARTDILQNLGLGTSGQAQTLTFDFVHVSYAATFVSSTVPNFPGGTDFSGLIWPVAGEPHYDEALAAVGHTGSPLPIMSGFHFLFDDAKLSIQEGYVSVLARVSYTSQ